MRRRAWLRAAASMPLAGCGPQPRDVVGTWVGAAHERGHLLRQTRDAGASSSAGPARAVSVLVIGAGVAGLACARALARSGIDDVHLVELEDTAGGNSRDHRMGGMACPLGAHYLPLPGPRADEVARLLEELGVRRTQQGRPVYDERHLCHSPQERLYLGGHWHDGLLPPPEALPAAQRAATLDQYRRYATAVAQAGDFAVPTARAAWTAGHDALDALTFATWLDRHGYDAPALRWYLDHCCRDDYGAGAAQVSAWAGLHYFASRHGFHPDEPGSDESREAVLTWPEGNSWLSARMAAPLADRTHTGWVALQVDEGREQVDVVAVHAATGRRTRWVARQVVLATPLFVSRRLLGPRAPDALRSATAEMRHAPWLVANLQLDAPLVDRPGAAPAWDNVIHGSPSLGYVDATHQRLEPQAGPTVLTSYWALGGDDAGMLTRHRAALLQDSHPTWARHVVADLSVPHPDLPAKLVRADLMRYGHAMCIPTPGLRSNAGLKALASPARPSRVHFAHADLSAHSVFEEALYHGERAARAVRSGFQRISA